MPPEVAAEQVEHAAGELGLSLSKRQTEQLLGHLTLLEKWSKVYNLTAIRDPAEMLKHHLVDSLSAIPALLRHLQQRNKLEARLLDVGSGAGFPGLTIAIVLPQCEVLCVDSVGKKVGFIRQVIAELDLGNARTEHGRIEDFPSAACDVITSRAFASLNDFTQLTSTHLAAGGAWMALKGRHPKEEIEALPEEIEMFHVEQLHPPGLNGERCLVWMRQRTV